MMTPTHDLRRQRRVGFDSAGDLIDGDVRIGRNRMIRRTLSGQRRQLDGGFQALLDTPRGRAGPPGDGLTVVSAMIRLDPRARQTAALAFEQALAEIVLRNFKQYTRFRRCDQ